MRTLGSGGGVVGSLDPRFGFNRPIDLLHQQFQAGQVGGPGFGGLSPDVVVQLQMMLMQVIGPMIQNMLNGGAGESFTSGPGIPGAYGGLDGGGYGQPGGLTGGAGGLAGAGGVFAQTPNGQSYGGIQGFFRDVASGLTNGGAAGSAGGPGAAPGYGGGGGGAYGPGTPGYGGPYQGGPAPAPGYGGGGPYDGPGDPGDNPVGETIPTNIDYRDLNNQQRQAISGMTDRERAVLHLWGIQMTSDGHQDGSVLLNVEQNPEQFQQAEVELARELRARDQSQFGAVTGRALDQEFFQLYERLTGNDISQRYANAPVRVADGPVDMQARLVGDNGLNSFENQVLQLWGHSPLFNNGQIDGNIINYALNSDNALEVNLRREDLLALREADLASDGVLNGDSLENAFIDTLDNLYLGAPGASVDRTMNDALEEAALRRQGLLPPVEDVPVQDPNDVFGPNGINGFGDMNGTANCPFLAGAAA